MPISYLSLCDAASFDEESSARELELRKAIEAAEAYAFVMKQEKYGKDWDITALFCVKSITGRQTADVI